MENLSYSKRCTGTDEYNYPSEKHGLLVFRIVQLSTFKSFCCLDHEKASLILSTERVVVETLLKVASDDELLLPCEGERERTLDTRV
jgi:hypothetical protein